MHESLGLKTITFYCTSNLKHDSETLRHEVAKELEQRQKEAVLQALPQLQTGRFVRKKTRTK